MVMKIRVPYIFGKFLSGWTIDGFSRRAQLELITEAQILFTLNLLDVISKIRNVAVFLIIDFKKFLGVV
jgi:hypothetical protein